MDAVDRPLPAMPSRRTSRALTCWAGAAGGLYALLVIAVLGAIAATAFAGDVGLLVRDRQLWHALRLSLLSASVATALALAVGIPLGCVLARQRFRGRAAVELVLDLPLVVPPVVLGFGLLAMFLTPAGRALDDGVRWLTARWLSEPLRIAYDVPAVVLAQFLVAAALAGRGAEAAFVRNSARVPLAARPPVPTGRDTPVRRDLIAVALITWARALGEFGPVLIAADAIALKTEVLPTSIYVELKSGNLHAAAVAALTLVLVALGVLLTARVLGDRAGVVAAPLSADPR